MNKTHVVAFAFAACLALVGCGAPPPAPCSAVVTRPWVSVTGDADQLVGEPDTLGDRADYVVDGDLLSFTVHHGRETLTVSTPYDVVDAPADLSRVIVDAPTSCDHWDGIASLSGGLSDWRVWVELTCPATGYSLRVLAGRTLAQR